MTAAPPTPVVGHTPGPWDFCGLNNRWGIYPESARDDGIDYFIARTSSIQDKAREKANAQLMAAAPDFLLCAQALVDHEMFNSGVPAGLMDAFRAAIAKATAR